jgi:putative transposase
MMRRREGKARAEARFLGLPGGLGAERAMQIIQIDHTKVDVTVVDPVERQPIGRPILTIGVDVFTRMVVTPYSSARARFGGASGASCTLTTAVNN